MNQNGLSAFKAPRIGLKPGVAFLAKFLWREIALQFALSFFLHKSVKGQELGGLDASPTLAGMLRKL